MKPDPFIDEPFLVEEPGAAARRQADAPRRTGSGIPQPATGAGQDFYVEGERETEDTEFTVGFESRRGARTDRDDSGERRIRILGNAQAADMEAGDMEAGDMEAVDMVAADTDAWDAKEFPPVLPATAAVESDTRYDRGSDKGSGARGEASASGAGNEPAATPPLRKRSKAAAGVNNVLTGDILSHKGLRRWYPFILYCVVLVFVYITHVFYIHRLETTRIREEIELNALRQKSLVYSADRMNATRQSRILEQVRQRGLGLQESLVPPKVIEP